MWKKLAAIMIMSSSLGANAYAAKPDAWVTTKAKLAMWTTGGISSRDVDVDTLDGVVTLHGKVGSAEEKAAAEREAHKIEGAKSVRNLLQVVPKSREKAVASSDKQIKEAVEAALKSCGDVPDIKVKSVNAGVVLLAGKADDLGDQVRAVRAAYGVEGVTRVASELKGMERVSIDREADVNTPGTADRATPNRAAATTTTTTTSKSSKTTTTAGAETGGDAAPAKSGTRRRIRDAWMTTEVKMRLVGEENVPAMAINVDTRDGVVTLFGTVPSQASKTAAEMQAKKVDGVEGVVNDLQIVPASQKEMVKADDKEVERQVKKAIEARGGELKGVDVAVKGGVVRLTGTVASRTDKLEAAMVSRSTRGVRSVSNDLLVKEKN